MTHYKLKVKNNVGDILNCTFFTELPAWEICKMYEEQCNCEILKLEKIETNSILSFLISPLKESIAYA